MAADVDRSTTGIVNLYTSDTLRQSSSEGLKTLTPEPLKSLEHLTTSISSIAWHPSSELLCTASSEKKDALRLVSQESHILLLYL
jgi:U3 small nucleolar RNA-associated protein 18